MSRFLFLAGCLSGAIGVGAGAFGAHALRDVLSPAMQTVFETGVRYQMYHALALLIVAVASSRFQSPRPLQIAGGLFIAGTLLFSGSLYLYVLSEARWAVFLTPVGGVFFLAGWLSPLALLLNKQSGS